MKQVRIDMTDEGFKDLEKLMERTGARTQKDLLNNALSLLTWAADQRSSGRIIASVDEKNNRYTELSMPIFDNVARVSESGS